MSSFLIIIIIHFLADFALQTNHQAQNKSAGWDWFNIALLRHVTSYSLVWAVVILAMSTPLVALGFTLVTFICHYITDWFTSRISKPLFDDKNYHDGFVVVGADQVAHYVQLYYTLILFDIL